MLILRNLLLKDQKTTGNLVWLIKCVFFIIYKIVDWTARYWPVLHRFIQKHNWWHDGCWFETTRHHQRGSKCWTQQIFSPKRWAPIGEIISPFFRRDGGDAYPELLYFVENHIDPLDLIIGLSLLGASCTLIMPSSPAPITWGDGPIRARQAVINLDCSAILCSRVKKRIRKDVKKICVIIIIKLGR